MDTMSDGRFGRCAYVFVLAFDRLSSLDFGRADGPISEQAVAPGEWRDAGAG